MILIKEFELIWKCDKNLLSQFYDKMFFNVADFFYGIINS